jgi:hypothetical protein
MRFSLKRSPERKISFTFAAQERRVIENFLSEWEIEGLGLILVEKQRKFKKTQKHLRETKKSSTFAPA